MGATCRDAPASSPARGWLSVQAIAPNSPVSRRRSSESPGNTPCVAIASIDGARVVVGSRRRDQRAAGADHVVVDHDALAGDRGAHAGDLGLAAVESPLVDERGRHAEVVGERLDPLRAAGVGAGEHEVVAAEPARRSATRGLP